MHEHLKLKDIKEIINRFNVNDKVKEDVYNVYQLIAEAESYAHQEPVEMVHFHEVGAIDAIVDILSVCYLLNRLGIDEVEITPIATGKGKVKCAHGILDVPAPATAYLLRELPHYHGSINSELCTPTGAALLNYFSKRSVRHIKKGANKVGIGFGKKEFDRPNIIKAYLYDTDKTDQIILLQANIDDMTSEEIGYAFEKLFESGARDVYIESIFMKKNRPGFLLNILVDPDKKDEMVKNIFKFTTTIGIREIPVKRYILNREERSAKTPFGDIDYKVSEGYETNIRKIEYENLKNLADQFDLPIRFIRELISNFVK